MKKSNLAFILLVSIFFGCQNAKQQKPETPQSFKKEVDLNNLNINKEKIADIDALLQSYVTNKKVNCVTAFVAKGGNIIYNKSFGFKDIENDIPASVDDYYVLFSQTKAITTVAFMTLVEKGLVAIDDPVSKYFPQIPNQVVTKVNEGGTYETRPVKSPMTFTHLMSHSSGLNAGLVKEIRAKEKRKSTELSEFGKVETDSTPNGQRSFGGNPKSEYLKQEMMDLVKYPLGFDPGSEWNYHISTNMLAYLIEYISGKSLQEYVKETILNPLGMNDTDWFFTSEKLSKFVKPYNYVDGKLEPGSMMYAKGAVSEKQTYAEGAIGLNGPIKDYAKFCQMLLNKGEFNGNRILKAETIEQMTTINRLPKVNSGGENFQFGLGFQLANEKNKHIDAVSNTAFWWGGLMGTEYIIDPENDLIALFYINMFQRESLYKDYLEKVYDVVDTSKKD
ncbi:serine hydrolase domain-containing protein [Polaribacter sp.]|uniref:serine hydrolase domain-containing protein n=1 Tax=Polaribacter sp. TaxID=1920175 RepID=UPI003F6CB6F8